VLLRQLGPHRVAQKRLRAMAICRNVRERAVMIDAAFEAVLATVLLLGVAFGNIDQRDFADPASDGLIALFALGLFVLAGVLGQLVKREAISDAVLTVLAVGNAGFALLLAVWVLTADGFAPAGKAVVWSTVLILLLLAATQFNLRGIERRPR
jgi:peptidoglycan/LPS O-acetylase OafA/YrhL